MVATALSERTATNDTGRARPERKLKRDMHQPHMGSGLRCEFQDFKRRISGPIRCDRMYDTKKLIAVRNGTNSTTKRHSKRMPVWRGAQAGSRERASHARGP